VRVSWGRLIKAAIDDGYRGEEAVYIVLSTARAVAQMKDGALSVTDSPRLTAREVEVLSLLADGRAADVRRVSDTLGIGVATVREHTKNIRAKLGVSRTRDAVTRGSDLGLLGRAA
jgi:DNA-binding CsgD family transcriptional regulator